MRSWNSLNRSLTLNCPGGGGPSAVLQHAAAVVTEGALPGIGSDFASGEGEEEEEEDDDSDDDDDGAASTRARYYRSTKVTARELRAAPPWRLRTNVKNPSETRPAPLEQLRYHYLAAQESR